MSAYAEMGIVKKCLGVRALARGGGLCGALSMRQILGWKRDEYSVSVWIQLGKLLDVSLISLD